MSKSLVLAEKPSVARDIAKALGCAKKGDGFMEGSKYVVTWALGHLITLADPEEYGKTYTSWNIEDLPIIPERLKTVVIKKTSKQFRTVKSLMNRKDISEIVIATDAGREGELVARWIIEKAGVEKPLKRLWISSVTEKAIKTGFNELKDGSDYESLYDSAVARAEADWYVGINGTRALTCKYNAQLSCGRVQTPTLAMVLKREEEIRNFKSRQFYGIGLSLEGIKFTWIGEDNSSRSFSEEKVDSIVNKLRISKIDSVSIKKKAKKQYAPSLYDLTELQKDANRLYNFSGKETLNLVQRLYENHKALTYPRTDSKYITDDMVETLQDRVKACRVEEYSKHSAKLLRGKIKANKSFVDNSKVSDHHAIIPTEQRPIVRDLSDKEWKIYSLVVARFLGVLMPAYEYEETTTEISVGGEKFVAKHSLVIAKGWKELYSDEEDMVSSKEVNISEDSRFELRKSTGETQPPARFTDGTLLSAMENPARYMENKSKDLVETLGKTGGIGTVATRADIVEKLFNSFLLEKKGNEVHITSKGKQLLDLVPEDLKSPALTAEWEQKLSDISKGKLKKKIFIEDMKRYTRDIVGEIKYSESKFKHDNITGSKCPKCGKYMLEVNSKKGRMLVCQDRECGHRETISMVTNARCPECKKKMELKGRGDSKTFVCKCGYREKLSSFNKRKEKQAGNISKKEVSKYLNKQKEESINSALAEALSKLKL